MSRVKNCTAFCRDNEVQRLFPYAVFLMHCKVISPCARYLAIPTLQFLFVSVYGTVRDTNGSSTRLDCTMLRNKSM